MGAEIGTSPGAGRAAALEIGDASAGSVTAGGVVRPGSGVAPVRKRTDRAGERGRQRRIGQRRVGQRGGAPSSAVR